MKTTLSKEPGPLVNVHLACLETPQVLDAIKYTIGLLHSFCATLHSEVLEPWHSPCLEHQARHFICEDKILEVWER